MSNSLSNKLNYRHKYNDSTVRHEQLNIPDQRDAAYELYIEECYDLGVTPVDMETYVVRNGGKLEWADTKRTYQDYRNEITREKRAQKREWYKMYYDKRKDDPEYKERRRKSRQRQKAKKAQKSSSVSTSSGSTGTPEIE